MLSFNGKVYARFIPREEVSEFTLWKFSAIDGAEEPTPLLQESTAEVLPAEVEALHREQVQTARDEGFAQGLAQGLEQGRAQGHEEGYAQGHAQGFEQGHAEATREWQQRMDDYQAHQAQEAAQRLASVMAELDASLTEMQKQMAQEMLRLACDIARQVVRRELRSDPLLVEPVVREALGLLVADSRPALVRLHPDDFAAFAEPRRAELAAGGSVQWLADASVAPGGCRVESGGMVIDGSLEKRWQKALAALGLEGSWRTETLAQSPLQVQPQPQPQPQLHTQEVPHGD